MSRPKSKATLLLEMMGSTFGPPRSGKIDANLVKKYTRYRCEHERFCEQRPMFVVTENEDTGEAKYIIKTGEYRGPHLIEYKDAGYVVTVNELGGLGIERLEKR